MLQQLKILDFTSLLPGPFGTMILADLGADVINIQKPGSGAIFQGFEIYEEVLLRNKQSLQLDLKQESAKKKIRELIMEYDIVVEGFRPGVMEKLNLDYDSMRLINEDIIFCSLTGYGQTGEMKDRAGHDINYLSRSGYASYSGNPKSGPSISGIQIADLAGSLYLAVSILSAFINRQNTGKGQYIDISMTDCAFSLGILQNTRYLNELVNPSFMDFVLTGSDHYGYYETSDHQFLSVGSLEPKFYLKLCEFFHLDPRNSKNLQNTLSVKFKEKTLAHWVEVLEPLDICIEPVINLDQVVRQEFFKERENLVQVDDGKGGFRKQQSHPVKYNNFEPNYRLVKKWNDD